MSFNGAELDHATELAKQEEIRLELLKQLEYYFSAKNLLTDNYLLSQMDADAYVPVALIAQFKRIKQLTRDLDLIIAIIRESSQLQLDPATFTKVRSVGGHAGGLITINTKKLSKSFLQTLNNSGDSAADPSGDKQQRCVLIMREVESGATLEQIKELFTGKEPLCPACDQCESAGNDSWYIMFSSEEQAQRALQYLKGEVQIFLGKPIRARIKAHTTIPRSTGPGAKLTTLSAVGSPPPVKVSEESPSSFLSLSPAPTVVLSEPIALTYSQQTFIPQLANYYNKIPAYVPAMSAQPTQTQMPYWQMSANPKLATYGLAPLVQSNPSPGVANKLVQNTSPALSTTNDAETKAADDEELPVAQAVIPPQPQLFQLPQHLAQMQLNPAGSYGNAGNPQAAAAVHAYYQSMSSQNQAYMTPPPPPLLASTSTSSLSNPVFNMNNITYSSNSGSNPTYQVNTKFMPAQQQTGSAHSYMPQQAYYTINNTNDNGEGSAVPTESNVGDSLNASFKAGASNASAAPVTPNGGAVPHPAQVTSPSTLYHPNHYLIANLNNLTMNNANSANAAAFNAAYQYYHAYNNALNTGYHPNHPQAGLHHLAHHQHHSFGGHPAPQQYFELVAGPPNAEPNSEEKQTFSSKEGFTSPQQTFMHQSANSNYPQAYTNMSAPNRSSPQLLISTMNGHNHQQHLNNNNNTGRRGGSTASLTETRFTPSQQQQPHHHHHHQQQQQPSQHSSGNIHYQQLNSRNNYFNKKYQTNHELAPNSGGQTSTSPVTLLSPNQQHFISYNQYQAAAANPYSYNSNHKGNSAYSIYSPAYPANVNPNINGFNVAPPHASLEKVEVKEEIAKTDPAAAEVVDNSGFLLAKSPPINSDFVSFPPLLNSEPAAKETEATSDVNVDSLSASAQLDPAIICISNSASSIPNAPTIIQNASAPTTQNGLQSSSKHFNPKHPKHLSKIIAANRGNDHSSEGLTQNSMSSGYQGQQKSSPLKKNSTSNNSSPDYYSPSKPPQQQQANYSSPNHQGQGSHQPYKAGGAYTRKSIDSIHFNNHNQRKFYQNNNNNNTGRHGNNSNYNSRQSFTNNNNYNNNSSEYNSSSNNEAPDLSGPGLTRTTKPTGSNNSLHITSPTHSEKSIGSGAAVSGIQKQSDQLGAADEDLLNAANGWNKRLTFAEILQKKSAAQNNEIYRVQTQQEAHLPVKNVENTSSSYASNSSSQATTPTTTGAKTFPLTALDYADKLGADQSCFNLTANSLNNSSILI